MNQAVEKKEKNFTTQKSWRIFQNKFKPVTADRRRGTVDFNSLEFFVLDDLPSNC